jgi:hypothetical protein
MQNSHLREAECPKTRTNHHSKKGRKEMGILSTMVKDMVRKTKLVINDRARYLNSTATIFQ